VNQPAIEAIMRGAGAGSDWWWVALIAPVLPSCWIWGVQRVIWEPLL